MLSPVYAPALSFTKKGRMVRERCTLLPAVPFDNCRKTDFYLGMYQGIQSAHGGGRLRCSFHSKHKYPDGIVHTAIFPVFLNAGMGNLFCYLVSQHDEVACLSPSR